MRTRRSPRNQEILWRELGGIEAQPAARQRSRRARPRKPQAEHWTAVYETKADPVSRAITELVQLHSHADPTCKDQGPTTCPTWKAIYGLLAFSPKIENKETS